MVNGQSVNNRDHEKLGGATSEGEFGSMLYDIFNPSTQADFHWEKWATWRGHRMHVYSFEVSRERSRYDIYHGLPTGMSCPRTRVWFMPMRRPRT